MTSNEDKPLCEIELKQTSLKKRNEAILKIITSALISISKAYSELEKIDTKLPENMKGYDDEN
ncbi:hypothetical protein KUL42_34350 [Alteromonas sp. KUL42]|uniref:hypothetical protein n=1 Tax=Alteromonas sp. KUL42 TaxID=2480797 RepID=UPI001035A6A3|nr:hypothetical protein [Alteromonas sp. KUL42]TAP32512.1 hypothetical protein EYR97_16960 [Alteromonas sp. KUL42]GEA08674.1 hypothetical protein KUL42_34350 [Alteromonas sp. KUL42]